MKRLVFILIILTSCKDKEVKFDYEVINAPDSAILIKNYNPVTREQLSSYLTKIQDTVKLKKLDIFIAGLDIQRINPNFKKVFYREQWANKELAKLDNDTIRSLKTLRLYFATFKNDSLIVDNDWNEDYLDNRFLTKD
jgi:hypothetical protein